MASQAKAFVTAQQYLVQDRQATTRSEYISGEVLAMAGASFAHNLIVSNLISSLRPQLRAGSCRAVASDLRVQISATGMYAYPDVVVVCGEPIFSDEYLDTLLNPILLVEVLSASTEAYDRGEKAAHYRRLESLEEYVLIAQDRVWVEHCTRQGPQQWLLTEMSNPQEQLHLACIGGTLAISDIYEQVDLGSITP
jgi:Uma2 family endonuclease